MVDAGVGADMRGMRGHRHRPKAGTVRTEGRVTWDYARLPAMKATWGPEQQFHHNQEIPPATAT